MHISKEKRMKVMLAILSVVDFGYSFDNITQIAVILSCILVLCSIVSVLFVNNKYLSQIVIIMYYGKELILYGPTPTWPVLHSIEELFFILLIDFNQNYLFTVYLFKLIGSQNYIFLLLFSNQIVFNQLDSLWIYNIKRKDHHSIQLILIFLLQGYSFYVKQKSQQVCKNLLIKLFKQDCMLQIFDLNYRNISENTPQLPTTNRLQTENTLIGSPRGDKINLIQDDKDIHFKLFLNNDLSFSIDSNQQPFQQQLIFRSTKELLQFLSKNNHYFIIAIYNDPLLNFKFQYQVKYGWESDLSMKFYKSLQLQVKQFRIQRQLFQPYFQINNEYILAFLKLDNGLFARQNHKILKYKQNLINIFNHKLKTPLNSAIGHLITAKQDDQVNEEIKKMYLQPALLNCRLQLYLVQDILDYLSIEIEQLPLMNNKTNLKILLLEVYDLIEYQCKLKNIDILFKINNENFKKIDTKSLFIYIVDIKNGLENSFIFDNTDSNKLTRVLLNILNNSYRYTEEGGCIMNYIKPFIYIILEIKLDQMNKITYFSITDNGQGMDEDQIKKLNCQLKSFDSITFTDKRFLILVQQIKQIIRQQWQYKTWIKSLYSQQAYQIIEWGQQLFTIKNIE